MPFFGLDSESNNFSNIEEELSAAFTFPDPYLLGIITVICISIMRISYNGEFLTIVTFP